MYHFVSPPAKSLRVVFTEELDQNLKEICLEISKQYEIKFIEIVTDKDYDHFLIQNVPTYSPTRIIQIVKSITAKKLFELHTEVTEKLWEDNFGKRF